MRDNYWESPKGDVGLILCLCDDTGCSGSTDRRRWRETDGGERVRQV